MQREACMVVGPPPWTVDNRPKHVHQRQSRGPAGRPAGRGVRAEDPCSVISTGHF
jgi:hypothetical protein